MKKKIASCQQYPRKWESLKHDSFSKFVRFTNKFIPKSI